MSFDSSVKNNFIQAFFKIDVDQTGSISSNELRNYMIRKGHGEEDVEQWLMTFDENNSGVITFEEFCHVLDIEQEEVHPTLPRKCNLIASDMHKRTQYRVYKMVKKIMKDSKSEKEAAKEIKTELDKHLERLWHCVIVKGQYWAFYSHEPEFSMVFRFGQHIFIVWRTPGY